MNTKNTRRLVIAAALIGMVNVAQAADGGLSLKALLDLKLQTGSFLELDLRNSPLTMTVIQGEQVRLSGAHNLSEALEIYVPGFQYSFNKWNGTVWAMRGVTGDKNDKIIVLVNGIKQNLQGFHGFSTETDLGLMGDIQRVEVLRGPAGLVYGSGAIAGVVNIVTKDVPTEDGGALVIKGESTLNKNNLAKKIEASYGKTFGDGSLVVNFGQFISDGIGDNYSRIYGISEHSEKVSNGNQSGGSYGKTPGNYLGSLDYRQNGFRAYGRYTRQYTSMGAFFLPTPFGADPASSSTKLNAQSYTAGSQAGDQNDWNASRRSHLRENMLGLLSYEIPVGDDKISLSASIDGATNRHMIDDLKMYSTNSTITGTVDSIGKLTGTIANGGDVSEGFLNATSGEVRRQIGGQYLLKRIPDLQLALGGEYRFDVIGADLQGNKSSWYDRTVYHNYALFTEGFYDISSMFAIEAGARWDKHTKTDGVFSPKGALIFKPNDDHTFKLIVQSSSNNADAMTYELGVGGVEKPNWSYEKGGEYASTENADSLVVQKKLGNLVAPSTQAIKDAIKPEQSLSYELASLHKFGNFSVDLSGSYNKMSELVLWNSALQRSQNVGEYTALTLEGGANWNGDALKLGGNIAYQVPLSFENTPLKFTRPKFTPTWSNTDKAWVPTAVKDVNGNIVLDTLESSVLSDQISIDGSYFNSIQALTAKAFADWTVTEGVVFHTDVRYFGGFWNRWDIFYKAQQDKATVVLPTTNDFALDNLEGAVKWNIAAQFSLNPQWKLSLYGNNLLGDPTNANAGRAQQTTASWQADYFTVDVRSFAAELSRSF